MRKIIVCLMAMLAFASGRTAAQAPFGQYSKQPWEAKYYQTSIDSDETPGTDWYQPEFDDSEWEQISGPISNTDAMYHATRWEPEGTVYWVRRHFMLESIDTDKFYLLHVVHDDGCVMYLNGNLIYENGGVRGDTENVLIFDQEKLSYLKEGDNLLSVKVGNTGRGDAYMDFGLYALDAIPVTRIDLSASNITLKINELARLSATTNADATNPSLVWSVADSTIATVTMDGLVQGVKAGTTTITVASTDNPDIVASCTVNVSSETAPVTILPWGKIEPWTMKYLYYELADYKDPQMDENGKEWTELGYDDAAWNSLTGPMASRDIWYSNWNYLWEGEYNCFCLRRTFTLSQVDKGFYVFQMQHDDDIRVYLNGQLVINEQGCTDANVSSYVIANDLFVEGENMLSIYIQNNQVNGFLDYSLVYQESGDYNVTAKSNGNGRVDGAGSCVANSKVMLTAIPDDGYRFVRWEDGSTENPRFLHVTEDREVSATFEEVPYYENMILSYGQWSQTPWSAKYYQTLVDDGLSPADNWYAPDFDDSQWEQISGPISNQSSLYHATRWEPEKTIYWVRRHFTMESVDPDKAYMLPIIHDDGCMVYLNGHLIYERGEVVGNADNRCYLSGEKASYLRKGDNILAVMVSDAGGGDAYMDFGLYAGNPVRELTLSHSAISVRKGTRMSLEALVNEDAFDESLSWSIADGNVASVVEDGIIYGNNVGQTTLTVTSLSNPEVSATCQIYVYEPDALQWILPWGKDEAWSMRYRRYELADYEEPAADANGKRWTEAGYDDAAWETLSGPMASEHVWYGSGNYLWEGENNCYCLRRTFTLQNVENSTYYFYTQHDDDIKVYVNGNLIVERTYYNAEEAGMYLIPSELLVVGENTLAIYIQQLGGDAYLDYAIGAEVKATYLTLSEENLTLKINEEAQLTATVDGTTSGVCWSVADGTIVSVTAEGKVRGKKTGTTTITATAISNPSVTATCTVTVTSEYAPLATGWLQPMGEEYPWTMRYQYYELADAASPADDSKGLHWYEVGYDDAEWQTLIGPLGGTTPWEGDNNCYYLRGTFVLPENAYGSLQFYAKHDDGIRVYINGVMVRDHGYDIGLHEFAIPDTLLHQGDNTIAVYAQEEGGEAYFDYGLYFTEASMCTVTVTSEGGGTVHGGGQYKIGTEVTLTAIPDDGYRFVRWEDGSTENPRTFMVNGDVELTVIFDKAPVIAPGTILPWGKDEAWTVKYLFNETADSERPGVDANGTKWYEPNYDDSSWGTLTGPIGDKNDYNYQWVGENNCFFLRRTFHLSEIEDKSLSFYVNHDNGIEVYLNGQLVVKNTEWTHDENSLYKISNEALVIGENTLAIYIKQEEGSTYLDYTLLFEDTRQQEELNDSRIVAIPEGTYYVYYTDRDGNRRYLQAAGEDNWVVGDEPTVITFSEGNVTDTQAYAHAASFMESNGYYMSVVKSLDGTGPISTVAKDGEIGAQKRTWESQVFYRNEAGKYAIRLTNTVGADWKSNYFVNVNSITLDVAAGTPTLGEEFYIWQLEQTDSVPNPSIKNVSVKASQGGIVTGGGEYVVGTEVTLTAVPEEGYRFVGWSDGSTENPRTLMVETDVKLFAEFAPNSYVITYWVDGWLYGYYYVEYGAPIPSMKEPVKEGYTFIGWSDLPETMPAMDLNVYSIFVLNAQQTDSLGLNYSLNDSKDAFEFSGYTDSLQAEVIIPSEVHGIPVTTIGDGAFMGATDLKSIVIPSSVTKVGDKAFGGCSNLLVVEWNSSAPVKSECFDDPASHGNMLVFVPAGATVTYEGNVIIGGVAEQITLIDGMPLRNPRDFIAQRVEYSREFTKQTYLGTTSGWEAMVLPFDVQRVVSETKGELKPFGEADFIASLPYWLAELQENGTFVAVQTITANKPFIMQLPNSEEYEEQYNVTGIVTFSAENATVCATTGTAPTTKGYTLQGSYEGTTAARDVYAINDEEYSADGDTYMPGGVFVANSRDIRPFEAYVYSNHAAPAPYLRIGGKGSTGIGHSTLKAQPSAIYDLMGRKVLKSEMLKKGIYIVNGKLNLKN